MPSVPALKPPKDIPKLSSSDVPKNILVKPPLLIVVEGCNLKKEVVSNEPVTWVFNNLVVPELSIRILSVAFVPKTRPKVEEIL